MSRGSCEKSESISITRSARTSGPMFSASLYVGSTSQAPVTGAYANRGMRNGEIAEAFEELASLHELDGAVVYRVLAYRNAAKAIREAGVSVEEMARQGRAAELAGVGKTIAEKIDALLE